MALDYTLYTKGPLIDATKQVFRRGKHQYRSLDEVSKCEPGYLTFLAEEANIDDTSREIVAAFLEEHPDVYSQYL